MNSKTHRLYRGALPAPLVLGLALFLPLLANAQIPPGYYDSVDESTQATLRTSLHAIIGNHIRMPYTSGNTDTWDVLEMADEDPENPTKVLDVYRNASLTKAGGGNSSYNREHVWPNSYGFPHDVVSNYPYTDCHALFLSDSGYNSSRGNAPMRYCHSSCEEKPTERNHGAGGGSGAYPGYSNWRSGSGSTGTWETWIGRRGDVARALFYMDVRYEGGFHKVTGDSEPDLILTDRESLIATSGGENAERAYMGILSDLLRWHREDPVDEKERRRNDVVYSFQGNRNPFIDHPEWVDKVFGNGSHLLFIDGRFEVEVEWENFKGETGFGKVVPYVTDNSGLFYFFTPSNWEMLVKVLDGCKANDHFWVFVAATTNVGYTLRVTDTVTGTQKEYVNPVGRSAPAITDTEAFDTCKHIDKDPPRAAFTAECDCLTCDFHDGSEDPDGWLVSYDWRFGDGSTSVDSDPSHSYSSAGTYTVRLTVEDNDGLSGSASHPVDVCACRSQCCRVCDNGKACGDSCISLNQSCHQPPGCACNDGDLCP